MQMQKLRHAVHQQGHVAAELLLDLLYGHDGILHHVVKQPRHDRLLVQLQIRQNNGHAERMDNIRLAGFPHLALMRFPGQIICLFDQGDII